LLLQWACTAISALQLHATYTSAQMT
jgi:hypothetical protein